MKDATTSSEPTTPARIINVSFHESIVDKDPHKIQPKGSKRKEIRVIEKRRRMMRRNAITEFFYEGKLNVARIFNDNKSPDQLTWKSISRKKSYPKDRQSSNLTRSTTLPHGSSTIEHARGSSIDDTTLSQDIHKMDLVSASSPTINCTMNENRSIFSTFPIMSAIDEYLEDICEETSDENMEELFEHWISGFVSTCQKQIKNVIVSTNDNLSRQVDMNTMLPIMSRSSVRPSPVKIEWMPQWNQVRIIRDGTGQKYIALKKSHTPSWFMIPRECPKFCQQWVCYPMTDMNTFENELKIAKEDSLQWMILRMLLLKCFYKIVKNDVVPICLDTENILLVTSNYGLIIVFKESFTEVNIDSFRILNSPTWADVPRQWSLVKRDIRETVVKFFFRQQIISMLISSIWPLDYMAYILANVILESDK